MSSLQSIQQHEDSIINLRRDFHSHPELGLHEERTASRIEEELDSYGILEHQRVGATSVWACLHGEKPNTGTPKTIVLRADIDALPLQEQHDDAPYHSQNKGIMHACGHDAHAACLLSAARELAQKRNSFSGTVYFAFQAAEEIGSGARDFVKAGLLKNKDRCFGLHVASDLPVGTVNIQAGATNAAVDHFAIKVHGKPAHVSRPHTGVDALFIAAQIVVGVQSLITRLNSPTEPLLVGIGKLHSGTAYNIVAAEAEIEGTTRTLSPETRARIKKEIDLLVEQTCTLYGASCEVQWDDFTPALINPAFVCDEVRAIAQQIEGLEVIQQRGVSLGGDNFADFQEQIPGVYVHLGTANKEKPHTCLPHHHHGFDIDESGLKYGVTLYVDYALSVVA